VLSAQQYLWPTTTIGNDIRSFRVSDRAFDAYLWAHLPSYERLVRSVALRINKFGERGSREIASGLGPLVVIVNHMLAVLLDRGYIVIDTSGIFLCRS
jgi:hypothetical protein